jgi:hypothetical protein
MADKLTSHSIGKALIQSGQGRPDSSIPASFYSDISDGQIYFRNENQSDKWEHIFKLDRADFYINNNATTTTTNQGTWTKIFVIATASPFNSSSFTYSSGVSTILSGTGNGGFENTITTGVQGFADNGWTVVNGAQTNKWFVGTTGASGGSGFGAYISNDNGATNNYTNTVASTTYFYRDIIVPAYTVSLNLRFACRVGGESTTDRLRVYNAPTTQNFVAGTDTATSQVLQVNLLAGYTTQSVTLNFTPIQGTQSRRIAFGWTNDASVSTPPGPSIDNITLTAQNPIEITYNGSQSTFSSLWTGSFQSSTAITTVGVQIAKNVGTISTPSESRLSTLSVNNKENFNVQNTFTLSSGDVVTPMVNNRTSSISVLFNDMYLSIWEIPD